MDTRTKILKEAGTLFRQQGIKRVTMDKISEHLGISKRTLYENFKDKNDLLKQSVFESSVFYREESLKIIDGAENVIVGIFRLGEFMHTTIGKINPIFFADLEKYYPDIYLFFAEKSDVRNYSLTYTLLKKGVHEGFFRKELNIGLVSMVWQEIITLISNENFKKKVSFSKFDPAISLFLPYLRGLCTEKGLKVLNEHHEYFLTIHMEKEEK